MKSARPREQQEGLRLAGETPAEGGASRLLGGLVLKLAAELEQSGVAFAFLRGHEQLPDIAPGSDIDLLVAGAQRRQVEELLQDLCARSGARIWQRFQAGFLTQLQLHLRSEDGQHGFLSIDLHTAEAFYGIPFLEAAEVLDRVEQGSAGLPVPDADLLAVINFLAPYLSGAVVNPLRAELLAVRAETAGSRVVETLDRLFGVFRAKRILRALLEADVEGLQAEAGPARRGLVVRRFVRAPLRSTLGLLSFFHGLRLRTLWKPRGLFLAFLGTDGCGKSTLLEALRKRLEPAFRSDRSGVWHLRAKRIPQLNSLLHFGRSTYSEADMVRPHRAEPSGRLLSNLRVAYYWFDYLLGHLLEVLPARRRQSLLLFDRYYHDLYVDPLRQRVRRGTWMVRLLAPLVPRPDHLVVVTATFETVRRRKQELSEEETAYQLEAYEAFARDRQDALLVRNDGEIESAVDQLLDLLFGGGRP